MKNVDLTNIQKINQQFNLNTTRISRTNNTLMISLINTQKLNVICTQITLTTMRIANPGITPVTFMFLATIPMLNAHNRMDIQPKLMNHTKSSSGNHRKRGSNKKTGKEQFD